jgi:hypothetical protein
VCVCVCVRVLCVVRVVCCVCCVRCVLCALCVVCAVCALCVVCIVCALFPSMSSFQCRAFNVELGERGNIQREPAKLGTRVVDMAPHSGGLHEVNL